MSGQHQGQARPRPVPAYALLALVLLLGLAIIPLPGVDQHAALIQLGRASGWWTRVAVAWPPAFSPLATGVLGLVLARLAMDLLVAPRQDPVARRLWIAITSGLYLGGTFAGGVAIGLTLEQRYADLLVLNNRVVLAMLIGLSTTAAAATLWSLATLIKRSGLASGALLLFFAWELVRIGRFLLELGFALFGPDGPEPGMGYMPMHSGLVALGLTCIAIWRWAPDAYPIRITRNVAVRGPVDLLAIPLVVGAIAGTLAADLTDVPAWTPQPPLYDTGLLARTLGSLLVVPALAVWVRRQSGAPGHWGWGVGGALLMAFSVLGMSFCMWWSPS